MEKILRIAMAQINPTVGDLKGNLDKIVRFATQAQELNADIITFPELAICGYPPEDLLLKEHFVEDNLRMLNSLVKKVSGIIAIVGFVDKDKKGNLYNAACIIHKGRIKAVYHKIELPNYGVFDEKRYFQSGKTSPVFMLGRVVFGINICEDIWKAKGVARLQANKGAELIINISASPYQAGKGNLRMKMLAERAREIKAYICMNNLVGGQDELVFDGNSMIIGPDGEELAHGNQFEEDMIVADLPLQAARSKINIKNCVKLGPMKENGKPN